MLAIPEVQRRWFVLLTEPQMERKAAARLIANRIKVYLPEENVVMRRGVRRIRTNVRRPLFRGYLFVRLNPEVDAFGHVVSAVGVHKFLRFGEDYATVSDPLMQRLFDIEQVLLQPQEFRGPSAIFQPGERVRVSEGPFSGLNADIIRLDDDQRITILLSLLGRYVPVTLEAEQLEKL